MPADMKCSSIFPAIAAEANFMIERRIGEERLIAMGANYLRMPSFGFWSREKLYRASSAGQ